MEICGTNKQTKSMEKGIWGGVHRERMIYEGQIKCKATNSKIRGRVSDRNLWGDDEAPNRRLVKEGQRIPWDGTKTRILISKRRTLMDQR